MCKVLSTLKSYISSLLEPPTLILGYEDSPPFAGGSILCLVHVGIHVMMSNCDKVCYQSVRRWFTSVS